MMIYLHLFATWCILEDRPFFCWDCCAVEIEAPEIVEDGRGRTRRGLACLLEELSLGPRWSVHRCPQCGYCLRFASSVPQFHILSHPFTSFHILSHPFTGYAGWKALCFPLLSRFSRFSRCSSLFHIQAVRQTPRFNLQDLNSNGLLEESELIELNEFIAVLHYGTDFSSANLRASCASA